VDDTIGDQ